MENWKEIIKTGDRVKHITGGDYETVSSVYHYAGAREGQCKINSLYWNYDDVAKVLEHDGTPKYTLGVTY